MSWLFIDTHAPGCFQLGFLDRNRVRVRSYTGRATRCLNELFRLWKRNVSNIDGVCVVAGPGSFSAVRTGVLYANLIARFLRVPLCGVNASHATPDMLNYLANGLIDGRFQHDVYVAPVYDAEPTITKSKHI